MFVSLYFQSAIISINGISRRFVRLRRVRRVTLLEFEEN